MIFKSKAVHWVLIFRGEIQFRDWNDPKRFSVNWNSRINPDEMTTRNFFILRNWNWTNSAFHSINKKNFWISFRKSEKMQIPSQKRTNFRVPIGKLDIFHSKWKKLNDLGLQNCNLFPPVYIMWPNPRFLKRQNPYNIIYFKNLCRNPKKFLF